MANGPSAGLEALRPLLRRADQQRNHRVHAAHSHLLELTGEAAAAKGAYRLAAQLTDSIPEQRYLNRRAATEASGHTEETRASVVPRGRKPSSAEPA